MVKTLLVGTRTAPIVLGVGAFDGVHRAHLDMLRSLRRQADRVGAAVAVLVADALATGDARLTTAEHRVELLCQTGLIDMVSIVDQDERATLEGLLERLVGDVQMHSICVDPDVRLGRNDLAAFARRHGVEVLDHREIDRASSQHEAPCVAGVAAMLEVGCVAAATDLLGRPHELRGVVDRGDQRGRQLGFPTANVAIPSRLVMPVDGVYGGVFVGEDGVPRVAAISLGRRPTFYRAGHRLLEAHVIDFEGDLYGQCVRVQFLQHVRPQRRFESVGELVEQLHRDVATIRHDLVGGPRELVLHRAERG